MFWIHFVSSIGACVLIIYLSLSCRFKKYARFNHKWLSIIMGLLGAASLISSLLYGFILSLSIDLVSIHYLTGFASLILSELPFMRYVIKSSKWHYRVGDWAAVFALASLITGLVSYWSVLSGYFIQSSSSSCISVPEMQSSSNCLVAVDGVVYDMTSMPRWQTGAHFDYHCGGNYSSSILPSSHSSAKYYGPSVGRLC